MIIAAVVGVGIPTALLATTIIVFASNPLAVIGCLSAMIGGGIYLLSYQEHE
jgi:hypothetical protein